MPPCGSSDIIDLEHFISDDEEAGGSLTARQMEGHEGGYGPLLPSRYHPSDDLGDTTVLPFAS